jgi:DNA-binding transcriptional MerR regulator
MRKPLSQLPLDFSGDENDPSPAPDANGNTHQQEGQYLATAGVGVRVKAYKQPMPPAEAPAAADLTNTDPTNTDPTKADSAKVEPIPVPEVQPTPFAAVRSPGKQAAGAKPTTKPVAKTGPSKRGRKSLKQGTAEADLIEIPADEVLFSKQYYTMGEVSAMFKVNQSLLRYWETEFDILQPRKNKKGDRYFRPVDIKNLHLIYHLLRQKKYTIEGAKDFLRNNKKAREKFEVIERLQQIRNFLLEWKGQL